MAITQRVDGDLDLRRARPGAPDALPDEQHGGLVPFPFPDHHLAGDLQVVDRPPHRLRGGPVRGDAIAASHEPGRGQRRCLGDANPFERQVTIHRPSSKA
jgi:hypothetical protein